MLVCEADQMSLYFVVLRSEPVRILRKKVKGNPGIISVQYELKVLQYFIIISYFK